MLKLYCVVFRTGTPNKFKWHRIITSSLADARSRRDEFRALGIEAHYEEYFASVALGLPRTYDFAEVQNAK